MKQENKEALLIAGIHIILAPFIIAYEILNKAYNCLPHKIVGRKRMNEEIKKLEEKLGKSSEENKHNTFDEYHLGSPKDNSMKEYLEILRQKVMGNYKVPDIIVVVENSFGSICCPMFNEEDDYEVLLPADSEIYRGTEKAINAKEYLDKRRNGYT